MYHSTFIALGSLSAQSYNANQGVLHDINFSDFFRSLMPLGKKTT